MKDSRGAHCFDKSLRIRKRREFLHVQTHARAQRTAHFVVLWVTRRSIGDSRMGVTVSRKIGCAVMRNRVKRHVREFFRHHRYEFPAQRDYVFVARKGAHALSQAEVERELGSAIC